MDTLSQRTAPASISTQADSPAQSSVAASPNNASHSRRRFLRAFGVGGAGVVVVATRPLAAPLNVAAPMADTTTGEGYRETEHVRDYYASTRL